MSEHTVDSVALKRELMQKISPALRKWVSEKAKELVKPGETWDMTHVEKALSLLETAVPSFFENADLVDIKKLFQIEDETEFLLLLEILGESAQFKSFFSYDEGSLRDRCILKCLPSIHKHCTRRFEEEAYYKNILMEYITHVQETGYPLVEKKQKLEIAYRALAELTGEDSHWYLGKQPYFLKAGLLPENAKKMSRIEAFKEMINNPENQVKLSTGLDSAGDIIIDKLFKAVKAIKSLFASSTEPKSVLPKIGFFHTNYSAIGAGFIAAVNKPRGP